MLRVPLSYYFLRAGVGESCAVAISGRVRRETVWVPLAKAQSLRAAQGPIQIQRSLGLASVHLDAAGRHTLVTLRDRAGNEAVHLLEELPGRCAARNVTRTPPAPPAVPGQGDAPAPTDRALPDA
jgi:membrane protein YdbS with pleckstrin-like domain